MPISLKATNIIAKYVENAAPKNTNLFGGMKSVLHTKPFKLKKIDVDELKLYKKPSTFSLKKPSSKSEYKEFVALFVKEASIAEASKMKKPLGLIGKIRSKLSDKLIEKALLLAKLPTIIIKNPQGKIVGGFGYTLGETNLHIGQIVLEPTIRNTKNSRNLFFQSVKEIKSIAQQHNMSTITCDVTKELTQTIKLYKRVGFKDVCIIDGKLQRLTVNVNDFGKSYL